MQVRIYGTGTEGKREKWRNPRTGKNQYWIVNRSEAKHNKGRLLYRRKWSPKHPKQSIDVTKDGLLLEAKTGEELEKIVSEQSRRYNWKNKKVKSPTAKNLEEDREEYEEYENVKGHFRSGKWIKPYRRRKRR